MMTTTKKLFFREKSFWINVIAIALILAAWEFLFANQDNLDAISGAIARGTGVKLQLNAFSGMAVPKPSRIVNILAVTPRNKRGGLEFFLYHAESTLSAALLGFFVGNLVAILFALLFTYVKPLEKAFMPVFLVIRSIPLVAVTPLLLRLRYTLSDMAAVQDSAVLNALFGSGQVVKMLVVVLIVFFPTMVNVHEGLKSVTDQEMELMKSMNASGWQIFIHLRVYKALPMTFSALKIASASSVLAVTVAEWLGSDRGLGFIMSQGATASLDARHVWGSIVIIVAFALLFYAAVSGLEKLLLPWNESVVALKKAMNGAAMDTLEE
jgi:NitT/TauT family transport system permease protein